MFVIFPFEKEFYARHGVTVDFVGHPLLDELTSASNEMTKPVEKIIALLPGSRRQEINYLLPEYLKVIPHFPSYRFIVAGMSNLGEDFYSSLIGQADCEIEWGNTYGLLSRSYAAIVTSGTATLETALHDVPEVICYKASPLSYLIARQLIKGIDYICIVNLIAGKKVVSELIQDDVNESALIRELNKLLGLEYRNEVLADYQKVREMLGTAGASARAAKLMQGYLQK
jgi:lipid-A-disaccharide synthase